jgi:hypothetical protein
MFSFLGRNKRAGSAFIIFSGNFLFKFSQKTNIKIVMETGAIRVFVELPVRSGSLF